MMKKLFFMGMVFAFVVETNAMHPGRVVEDPAIGVVGFVDDERVNRLPQRLRQPALGFYEAFESFYRDHVARAPLPERMEGNRGFTTTSFNTHYFRSRVSGGGGDSAPSHSFINFIDWLIAEDGIGRRANETLARSLARPDDFHNYHGARVPEATWVQGIPETLNTLISDVGTLGNPYAQYLNGILRFHQGEDLGSVVQPLMIAAARNHYGRALTFLSDHGMVLTGSLVHLNRLIGGDPLRSYLRQYIERDGRRLSMSGRNFEALKQILWVLPGNTERLFNAYRTLTVRLTETLSTEIVDRRRYRGGWCSNLWDFAVLGTATAGFVHGVQKAWDSFGENTATAGEGVAFAGMALKAGWSWIRVPLRRCALGLNTATRGGLSCCLRRRVTPYGMSPREVLDEVRLTSLYAVAFNSGAISHSRDMRIVDTLYHRIQHILNENPLPPGDSLSGLIVTELQGMQT